MEVGLSLGSNLGRRLEALVEARRRLAALPGVRVVAQSAVYETHPLDVAPEFEPLRFLNAVLILESGMEPESLSRHVHAIEAGMGRTRGPDRNRPRPIDLDIIYAGRIRRAGPEITMPHPRWAERRFVVLPLAEVRPELTLPGQDRTVREILEELPEQGRIVLFAREW